ncbi:hypothetical protein LTR27_000280 [Elasticomyces elasticus]|nr:hypothetical protein LTR27_000280 [Elasticomyces elasticus]
MPPFNCLRAEVTLAATAATIGTQNTGETSRPPTRSAATVFAAFSHPDKRKRDQEKEEQRFKAYEASLPPEQQFSNRDDWDQPHEDDTKLKSAMGVMRRFVSFTESLGAKEGDANHGISFFDTSSEPPSEALLRQYLTYYCRSTEGQAYNRRLRSADDPVHVPPAIQSVKSQVFQFFQLLRYFNKQLDLMRLVLLQKTIFAWVDGVLVKQEGITREKQRKQVAFAGDVQAVIDMHCSQQSEKDMALFRHRNFLLAVNIFCDNAIRTSEIMNKGSDKKTVLSWGQVSLTKLEAQQMDGPVFRAEIRWPFGKGRKNRPEKARTIPMHNLPPNMIMEDSCTQLLLLAFDNGVLQDFDTIEDLLNAQAPRDGIQIRIKPECKATLVAPISQSIVRTQCERLGQRLGYQTKLKMGAFRRGTYYHLYKTYGDRTTKRLMKWNPGSNVYEEYEGDVEVEDTQAAMRGTAADPNTPAASIRSGRVAQGLPTKLDDAHKAIVEADPSIVAAKAVRDAATKYLTELRNQFASTKVVAEAQEKHKTAQRALDYKKKRQQKLILRAWHDEIRANTFLTAKSAVDANPQPSRADSSSTDPKPSTQLGRFETALASIRNPNATQYSSMMAFRKLYLAVDGDTFEDPDTSVEEVESEVPAHPYYVLNRAGGGVISEGSDASDEGDEREPSAYPYGELAGVPLSPAATAMSVAPAQFSGLIDPQLLDEDAPELGINTPPASVTPAQFHALMQLFEKNAPELAANARRQILDATDTEQSAAQDTVSTADDTETYDSPAKRQKVVATQSVGRTPLGPIRANVTPKAGKLTEKERKAKNAAQRRAQRANWKFKLDHGTPAEKAAELKRLEKKREHQRTYDRKSRQ